MDKLPRNLVEEIMSRTLPESLIQFKLVSKPWYKLITSLVQDPKFVAKNLEKTKKASSFTSLAFINDGGPYTCKKSEQMIRLPQGLILERPFSRSCVHKPPYLLTVFHEEGDGDGDGKNDDNFRRVTEDSHLPRFLDDMNSSWWPRQYHCDGIVCFFRDDTDTGSISCSLCNPTIKELRALPKPTLSGRCQLKGAGLAYDSKSDDYKFVIIGYDSTFHPKAEMYSLNNDCWKEIRIDWRDLLVNYGEVDVWVVISGIVHSEVLYWIINHRIFPPEFSLISFDAADEMFRGLPLPSDLPALDSPRIPQHMRLTVWNESLALLDFCGYYSKSIEIWVMDDQCSSCSWTKRLIIDPLPDILHPLTFWNGDELLLGGMDQMLISYNVRSRKKRILAKGVNAVAFKFLYVKSLVSVHRRKWKEAQMSGKLMDDHRGAKKRL